MEKFTTALVPCSVSSGMFPGEYAVAIELNPGKTLSLFAEESDLEDIDLERGTARLKVKLMGEQHDEKREVIMYLPKESLETGNHLLQLPHEKILQRR